MRFEVKTLKPADHKTALAIVAVFTDGEMGAAAKALDKASGGAISAALENGDSKGNAGDLLLITRTGDAAADRILLVGCGARKKFARDTLRQAAQAAIDWLKTRPYEEATSYLAQESIKGADLAGVGNPPEGFLIWADSMGIAVLPEAPTDYLPLDLLRSVRSIIEPD